MLRGVDRWRQWARSLASRGGSLRRRSAAPMTLPRMRGPAPGVRNRAVSISARRSDVHVALEWRPSFTFFTRHETPGPAAAAAEAAPVRPAILHTLRTLASRESVSWTETPGSAVRTTFLETVFARGRGIDERVARTRRIEERVARTELVTVSRSPAPGRSPESEPDRMQPGLSWLRSAPGAAAWAGEAQQAPPPSVEAITEHVMRRIDDRITAWRERMGRG
jgi:hypothetical protein